MTEMKLEFYTMRHDFNTKKVYWFNIFGSNQVYNDTVRAVVRYLSKAINYDEMKEEIDHAVMYKMWSRCEYEISVGEAFESDASKLGKYSVYDQVKPNLDTICRYVISVAREYFYNEDMLADGDEMAMGAKPSIWIDEFKGQYFTSKEKAIAAITDEDVYDCWGSDEEDYWAKQKYINWNIKEYKPWY